MAASLDHPLILFIVQAATIVLFARGFGLIARRLGQPMVVAELFAGIVLGPSLLGWAWPSGWAALFPAHSLPVLDLLSQVGLILFMFLIGLELDPKLLRGRAPASVAISHASILLPFLLGGFVALYLYPKLAPAGVAFVPFVLFMGAAMSISAFPVLARIVVERRLVRSRVGAVAIACAAVDNVTAWCILAFVVSSVRSASLGAAIRTSLLALGYVAVMLFVLRPVLQRLADRTRLGLSQNLVAVLLVCLLGSSVASELIGIHALFGAFLFGAILPKQGSFPAALAEKLEDVVVVMLLPLFFAYSGLRTQIGLLDSLQSWLLCALILVVACLGKVGGAVLAARALKLPWREAGAIGILLNTRGLMALIVLNIGLDLGVISPALFTMLVLMALVTTLLATPLLELVYPLSELMQQLSKPAEPAPPATQEGFTALVCVGSEHSGPGLVTVAAAIGGRARPDSRVFALRLVAPGERAPFVMAEREDGGTAAAQEAIFAPLFARAKELELDLRPLSFVSSAPARDICDLADVKEAHLVLLGWHKPLLSSTLLSGTVHEVMRSARADVALLVDRGIERLQRILVPYLGSEHDHASLELARRIAENVGASLSVLGIAKPGPSGASSIERRIHRDLARFESSSVELEIVTHAQPANAVIEASRRGYDLVVIGVGKEWGLEHRAFGFQPDIVLERSVASLLVVRSRLVPVAARSAQPEHAVVARLSEGSVR